MRLGRLLTAFIGVAVATSVAWAALPPRKTGINRAQGVVLVNVGLQDLFRQEDRERLKSGFATKVMIRMALYREGAQRPIAESWRASEIVYDLWDEKYYVRRREPTNLAGEEKTVARLDDAIGLATALVMFPLVERTRLVPGVRYRLSFRADLNPISEELASDVRRWLSRPGGEGRTTSGDGVFGSFVSLFVNPRIEESERRIEFFSQSFSEPLP